MIKDLKNGYSASRDKWPKDLESTYTRHVNYRFNIKNYSGGLELTSSGLTYINNQLNGGRVPSGRRNSGGRSNGRDCGHGDYYEDNKRKSEEEKKKAEADKKWAEAKSQKIAGAAKEKEKQENLTNSQAKV